MIPPVVAEVAQKTAQVALMMPRKSQLPVAEVVNT